MSSSKLSLADPAAKRHPLTGATMNGADMIVQVLADEGVDTVFGYSGGAILPTYDAVFRYNESHPEKNVRLVVPATEQGAGFMAAGYARSSGKVGVSLVTSGPGATNSVTPVRLPCGLRAHRADLRSGAARRHGYRRLPGSPGLQHHVRLRQAR